MRYWIWAVVLLCLLALPLWSQEKRVTIELKDAPITEAFDQLFRAAGENFVLESGVPPERRLTMRLVDIPFEKALNFLCDLAGLRWEKKEGVYVVSTKTRFFTFPPLGVPPETPVPAPPIGAIGGAFFRIPLTDMMAKLSRLLEQRCLKCGTVIRRNCPHCKRPMGHDWRFCPYDGKELPPAPQKCPKCGAELVTATPVVDTVVVALPKEPLPQSTGILKFDPLAVGKLSGSYHLQVTDDVILIVMPTEEVTAQVLEDAKVLAEHKLSPMGNLLFLSEILGKKPVPAGTYRVYITKKGQKIAELTFVVQRR